MSSRYWSLARTQVWLFKSKWQGRRGSVAWVMMGVPWWAPGSRTGWNLLSPPFCLSGLPHCKINFTKEKKSKSQPWDPTQYLLSNSLKLLLTPPKREHFRMLQSSSEEQGLVFTATRYGKSEHNTIMVFIYLLQGELFKVFYLRPSHQKL